MPAGDHVPCLRHVMLLIEDGSSLGDRCGETCETRDESQYRDDGGADRVGLGPGVVPGSRGSWPGMDAACVGNACAAGAARSISRDCDTHAEESSVRVPCWGYESSA